MEKKRNIFRGKSKAAEGMKLWWPVERQPAASRISEGGER